MGIQGLLPLLKSIQRPTELKSFSGETFGVDAYGWLHRGAIACAVELAHGKPTRKYVDYAMHRVKMLKFFGVTPYLVFDGDFLPSKAGTEASRAKRREESKKAGLQLLRAGKPSQAHLELQKAIDITPEMARNLIEELKAASVPYVVAPYEADAQLVYLERQGSISGIITEDSDLLVFGAKRLLTKLDQHGQCIEVNRRDFCAVREVSLTGWTDTEFRQMAILSGCDYLEGLNKMGLKTAYRMMRKHKTPERVIRMLQFDGKFKVPEGYLAAFKQAELTFLYQRVFCPKKQHMTFLTEPDPSTDVEAMPFIGAELEADLARAIAVGDVNPITKEKIMLSRSPESRSPGKRRASQTGQPAAPKTRPPGKSIESFFKGNRRIPLGEMDPNCFVVQPGQVGDRTEDGQAPRVFPFPRPYVDGVQEPARPYTTSRAQRRRTEPLSRILGLADVDATSHSRRRSDGPGTLGVGGARNDGNSHSPRPSKKARLCDDGESPKTDKNQCLERSKFFPAKSAAKATTAGSIIHADSPAQGALSCLPDLEGWQAVGSPRNDARLRIFDDRNSPEKTSRDEDGEAIPSSTIEVPASSPPDPSSPKKLEASSSSETPLRETLRQFSYQAYEPGPTPTPSTRFAHGLPTPASSMASTQKATASGNCTPPTSQSPMPTPLQRISARALHRSKGAAIWSPSSGHAAPKQDNRRLSYSSLPVNPSFVPLPKVDPAEVEALSTAFGSEDQIIPDSDGENDLESDILHGSGSGKGVNGSTPTSRLNLSRFLYR